MKDVEIQRNNRLLDVAHALVKLVSDATIAGRMETEKIVFTQPELLDCVTDRMYEILQVSEDDKIYLSDNDSILVALLSYRALKIHVFGLMDKKLKKLNARKTEFDRIFIA